MCAPRAPDPSATIGAQTASNRETALANAQLGNVNQVDAQGNKLTYTSTPGYDGLPQYTATQTLGAAGQQLQNTNQVTQQNLANLGQEQSGRLSGLLNQPNDWSAQKDYLNNLTAQNLDPLWARQGQEYEQSLANRGIKMGSEGYRVAMSDFSNNKSSAYNNANLNNFTTAQQSQAALRAAPLNEISALMGGSQVQSPQFTNPNTAQMAGTDVGGITNQGYANQMSQYNAQQKQLGGLFNAGGNLLMMSDRRAKTGIERIGQTDSGVPVYTFRYISGGGSHVGYMAQDLLELQPDAVAMGDDGFYRVDYAKVV